MSNSGSDSDYTYEEESDDSLESKESSDSSVSIKRKRGKGTKTGGSGAGDDSTYIMEQLKKIKNRMNELEDFQVDIQKTFDKNYDKVFDKIDDIYSVLDNAFSGEDSGNGGGEEDEEEDDEYEEEPVCSKSRGCCAPTQPAGNLEGILKFVSGRNDIRDYLNDKVDRMDLMSGEAREILDICFDYINLVGAKVLKQTDIDYLLNLSNGEKLALLGKERELKNLNHQVEPARFRILKSSIPMYIKDLIFKKMNILANCDPSSSEFHKLTQWMEGLLKVPFDTYAKLPVSADSDASAITGFLDNSRECMDRVIYGQDNTKEHIIQIIAKMITNPQGVGNVFAIHGPMGVGKTTIIKDGMSKALGLPFCFISLGGAGDSSYLDGHGYTYEGSCCGLIIECLKSSKCMNPIFYFDELDKVSNTSRGQEITNLLIHLTDSSQNSSFQDKYYSGIHFDLSKAIFVFSFNILENVNPILRDRMNLIRVGGFNMKEKIEISRKFLIPSILGEYRLKLADVEFGDEIISYIVNKIQGNEEGVRNIKRRFEQVISKLNVMRLYAGSGSGGGNVKRQKIGKIAFPLKLDVKFVDKLLVIEKCGDEPPAGMYC